MAQDPLTENQQQIFGPVMVPGQNIPKNSWLPSYPDQVGLRGVITANLIPAIFFVAGAVIPSTYNPNQLDWTPCYDVVLEQPYAIGSTLPEAAEEEISQWYPEFQDYLFRPSFHAPLAPFHFWSSFTPVVQNVDQYAWRGYFPDRVERQDVHASQLDWYFKPETPLPAAPPLSWSPNYPARIDRQIPTYEGWSVRGPELSALYQWRGVFPDQVIRHRPDYSGWYAKPQNEPPDIARLGWRSQRPDWIERRIPEPTGWYVRPLREPDDIARLGWRGQEPDQHLVPWTGAHLWPSSFKSPLPMAAAPALSWHPTYPDFATGPLSLHAALQRWHFFNPFPITAPDQFAWRGVWPDQVFRRELTAAHVPSYFKSPLPMAAAPPLSWGPSYPDRALGPLSLLTAATPFYFKSPLPMASAPLLSWAPSYPEATRSALVTPGWLSLVYVVQAVDQLGWRGVYPDLLAPPLSLLTGQQQAFFKSPLPMAAAPPLSWGPVYPDRALGALSLAAALQRAVFFDPFPIAVPTSQFGWRGSWPDQVFASLVHASRVPAYFKSPLPMPAAPLLSWTPVWPQPTRLPVQTLPYQALVYVVQAVDQLHWQGVWPDLHPPPKALLAAQQQAYFKSPLPMAAAPPLSWGPSYPLFIEPGRSILTAQQPFYFKSPLPMAAAPLLSWSPTYPVWLPPVTLTAAHHPAVFRHPLPQVVPLSWSPDYPSLLLPVPLASSVVVGSLVLPVPVDQFGWRGQWPVWIPRQEVHASRVPSTFEPTGFLSAQAVPPLSWAPSYPDFVQADRFFRLQSFAYVGTSTILASPHFILEGDVYLVQDLSGDVKLVQELNGVVTITTVIAGTGGASAKED